MHLSSETSPGAAPLSQLADEELVQLAAVRTTAKERESATLAFQVLHQRYAPSIYSYLTHQVQSAENAQDLTQETFLKAWKGVPHLWGGEHVRAWLFQIAINETKLCWRRQKLKAALSLERLFAPRAGARAEEVLPGCLSAPGFEEAVGEQECIRATLSRMPPHYRECLLLYDHFGFKQAEIARLLQIEESTVSANLYRARARFRQLYRQITEGREQGGSPR